MTLTKQEFLDLLHQGPVQVKFTKVDGTERSMVCTLQESYLPARPAATTNATGARKPEHIVPVWSILDQGWRSIRVDSVKSADLINFNG